MTATSKPARRKKRNPSKERLRLWLKLLKASSLVEGEVRRRLRSEFDWTLPRFDVMATLSRKPDGMRMSEISRFLRVSNGNVTGIVDKLCDEGLALRMSVPGDRRANLVRLTTKGETLFARQATRHEAWINDMLGSLTDDDVKGMMMQLDALASNLEETR